MSKPHIYLIPGFFGFSRLGGIDYFRHVDACLDQYLTGEGIDGEIIEVSSHPTASIRSRTRRLAQKIHQTAPETAPIHLIGHSTGGLDARLLVTPTLSIGEDLDTESIAERVESIVTVATPHLGTPIASFFDGLLGQKLLYIWSLGFIYVLRYGRLPVTVALKLVGILVRLDDQLGFENTVLDELYEELFTEFNEGNRRDIQEFLNHIIYDQSALGQITPGGIDLMNATAEKRPTVRYGSVATEARKPGLGTVTAHGFNPYQQMSHLLFQFIYRIAARTHEPFDSVDDSKKIVLRRDLGRVPDKHANDGIVPTRSQLYGELLGAVTGDHLDVCGHFHAPDHHPPHIDWLASGSDFGRRDFEQLWGRITKFIAR